ncbi:hypothetical protein N0V93_003804 [Gnomoniopsis smithogilvyi]|uniref:Uncharacterized protein n=1 Tax=Gnomoniopsis smithogilvyi TaxID=1191159 RepID=A0A9W9CYZ7_9PEZI|nr:hypothetical protein N0V93_003804 [Gnomoniopsis smithogilvyi]
MPPRPTSRCYPPLQSSTDALAEAVWVTDDILGSAFQRYVDVSRAHRRTVSYAPGPMYHRKRFGRRQMTELNSYQSVGALPVWALSNAPDLMQWQWQPPKPDLWSSRPHPSPLLSPSPPPAPAPSIVVMAPPPEPEAALQASAEPKPSEFIVAGEQPRPNNWKFLHTQLHAIRTNHVTSSRAYNDACKDFLVLFQCALSEGKLSGSEAADIYKTAARDTEILERRFGPLAAWFRLSLMSRLASGVKSAREAGCHLLLQSSSIYMRHLVQHEANVYSADLLAFAMAKLRLEPFSRHHNIALTALNHFFDLWRGTELHGVSQDCDWSEVAQASQLAGMWAGRLNRVCKNVEALSACGQVQEASRQLAVAKRCLHRVQRFTLKSAHLMSSDSIIAEKIASALKDCDPQRYRLLYSRATKLLGGDNKTWSRARYNWLQVMARLPKIRTSHFNKLLDLFPRRGYAALSHTELCNLLLLHWESTGKIDPGQRARCLWNMWKGDRDCTALAALALAINKMSSKEGCTGAFWGLWEILRLRGGPRVFLRQLYYLSRREKLSDGFLKRLAWTSDDHRIALFLHSLSREQGNRAIWWPAFWDKFAGKLRSHQNYPPLDPVHLLKETLSPDLDLRPHELSPSQSVKRNYYKNMGEADTQPFEALAAPFDTCASPKKNGSQDVIRRQAFQKQCERLKFGLRLLVRSRHVTDRQALRVVTQFTKILANKQGYLSANDLATLTSVMMRTLDRGECGSKARFRWYLGVICKFLGEDVCMQVGLILKRRRDVNWLIWRRKMIGTVGSAKQTRDFTSQLLGLTRSRPSPMISLWDEYVNYNRRMARRKWKLRASTRISRGRQIASCRAQLDAEMVQQRNATRLGGPSDNGSSLESRHDLTSNGNDRQA